MALWLLPCVVLLTACASPETTQIKIVKATVPGDLLTCPTAPVAPGEGATQRAVAGYLLDLFAAHAECRQKLDLVRGLVAD
jgi:uncharacterized lipoprotein YajG